MVAEKSFALKLGKICPCQECKSKVENAVKEVGGVHSCNFEANEGKLTVSGTVDRRALLAVFINYFEKAKLLSGKQAESKSLQIVAAKLVQGLLHHNPPDDQLQQLSTKLINVERFSMVAEKSFALELKEICRCKECKSNVEKAVKKAGGVYSCNFDTNEGKLTVSGTVDSKALLDALRKHFKAKLLWEKQVDSKGLQIVTAKPVHGVHDNPPRPPQLHHLSENNQGKAFDDDEDNKDDDRSLAMSTTMENKICQSSHKHDLVLKNYNKPFTCSGCKELGFGPRFKCDNSSCEYELHKECKECCKSKREFSHEFLKGYTFKFCDQLSKKVCYACGKNICGFGYQSDAKGKKLYLHPCCSKLESEICIDGYDFKLHDKVLSKCKWCDKKEHENGIPGWSYNSDCKKYQFHVYCVTEMVHQAWKKGDIDNIDSMALEKMDLQLLANSKKHGGKGFKIVCKTVKIVLKTIVAVLLGDPSVIIAALLEELMPNK